MITENGYVIQYFLPGRWMENRLQWLKRVLASSGYRSKQLANANFGHYRSGLILLGVIHGLYTIVFQVRVLTILVSESIATTDFNAKLISLIGRVNFWRMAFHVG